MPILYSNKKTRPVTGDQIPTFKHAMQVITDMTRGLRHREDVDIYQTGVKFTTLAGAIAARTNPRERCAIAPLRGFCALALWRPKSKSRSFCRMARQSPPWRPRRTTKNDYWTNSLQERSRRNDYWEYKISARRSYRTHIPYGPSLEREKAQT